MEILCLTIVIKQKCLTSILPSVGVVDNGTSPLCSDILDNNFKFDNVPVSYTHLTLPTIYSV